MPCLGSEGFVSQQEVRSSYATVGKVTSTDEGLNGNLHKAKLSLLQERIWREMPAVWLQICSNKEMLDTKMIPGCKADFEDH